MTIGAALPRIAALAGIAIAAATCAVGAHTPGDGGGTTATTSSTTSGGDGGQDGCASSADCPAPPDACTVATCTGGVCGTANAPQGTVARKDSPADCHAMVCDGKGTAHMGVDTTNVPVSSDPCLVGTCDAAGNPGTTSAPAGVACSSAGGKLCDGSGNCVACLHDADCPSGQTCSIVNACMGSHCVDGVKDVNETDVDCGGGTCPACAAGRMCKANADCASGDCDPLYLVCLSPQCADGAKDGNESDVDCGGSCSACALGKACLVDQDCLSKACDAISHACVTSQCVDQMKDGSETDVDCGGGTCPACALGQACKLGADCVSGYCGTSGTCATPNNCVNETDVGCGGGGGCPPCALGKMCQVATDCVSMACDALTLACVTDHCSDHALDGDETDIDCGGPTCAARCTSGKWCKAASDCASGLTCGGSPGICE